MDLRALLLWFLLMVLAVVNGSVRIYWIIPSTGDRVGHWISTVMLCALILATTYLAWHWLSPRSMRAVWRIGALWLLLTLSFELIAGHFLFGRSWTELLAEYDVMSGRIWVLVPLVTLLAPVLVAMRRGVPT